ncbi:MAG: glycosyltransferase family 2 protein [Candidatus Diapherotrites archaeon]|uniref:Glycosyltransferase family 2 protein n=1 Tax=Candidatus Iainarchaeum sp. TaxID=3101447 RepID=A0A8T3YLP0_9ARCH|nr:glycosyltransferase family 2 protein [Candidatus Diapherotrites archaeon]
MPSVTIGVTAPHTIPAHFLTPFLALLNHTGQKVGNVSVSMSTHYCTYEARNICARAAIKNGSDYLFFLDADILAPPDTIERLVARDKDIISGPYHLKSIPYRPLAYMKSGKEGEYNMCTDIEEEKLYEVDGVGGGCLLIKRHALEKVGDPYFSFALNGKNIGEDLYFCSKAQKAGCGIWYDNTIPEVKHFGAAIGFNDFKAWNFHIKRGAVKFNAGSENPNTTKNKE